MKLEESAEFAGMDEPDKILVRSNGTVTYTGKDIAYQLWKLGLLDRTFRYKKFWTYPDRHVLWETTSGEGSPDAPKFGGARRAFNVIDVRQSYLQKVVKEGLRLLGYPREAENSIHFSYEMVALTPATANALGIEISADDAKKSYLEMSGRKGLGVKADDLMDVDHEVANLPAAIVEEEIVHVAGDAVARRHAIFEQVLSALCLSHALSLWRGHERTMRAT